MSWAPKRKLAEDLAGVLLTDKNGRRDANLMDYYR